MDRMSTLTVNVFFFLSAIVFIFSMSVEIFFLKLAISADGLLQFVRNDGVVVLTDDTAKLNNLAFLGNINGTLSFFTGRTSVPVAGSRRGPVDSSPMYLAIIDPSNFGLGLYVFIHNIVCFFLQILRCKFYFVD